MINQFRRCTVNMMEVMILIVAIVATAGVWNVNAETKVEKVTLAWNETATYETTSNVVNDDSFVRSEENGVVKYSVMSKGKSIFDITFEKKAGEEDKYKMTMSGRNINKDFSLTIGDTKYDISIWYVWAIYIPVDVTDPDNPIVMEDYTYVFNHYWQGGIRVFYSWMDMPENYMLADTSVSYQHVFEGKNVYQVEYIREEGTHTYTSNESHQDKKSLYGYVYPKDKDGKNLSKMTNGMYPVGGSSMMIDDTQKVWCIEPGVNTWVNCKYEARAVKENIDAAMAIIFGEDTSDLRHITMQGLVWSYTGSDFGDVTPVRYGSAGPEALSEEDAAIVQDVKDRIQKAKEAYVSDKKADFELLTDDVKLKDGKLSLKTDEQITEVVLKAKNKDMLEYYAKGTIEYPEGITGEINTEEGTLTLKIDTKTYKNGSELKMSMIPEEYIGETTEYYSNYGKQTLVAFRLQNPNWETLSAEIQTTDKPVTPTEDDKNSSVQTGDEMNIALYAIILIVSAGAAATIIVARKKRTNE